jgi:hypothetical protein
MATNWTIDNLITALNDANIEPVDLIGTLRRSKIVLDIRSEQANYARIVEEQRLANIEFEARKQESQARIAALEELGNSVL